MVLPKKSAADLDFEPNTYRPIVYKLNMHVSLKLSALSGHTEARAFGQSDLIEDARRFWQFGLRKAGPSPLAAICKKGKLGD